MFYSTLFYAGLAQAHQNQITWFLLSVKWLVAMHDIKIATSSVNIL